MLNAQTALFRRLSDVERIQLRAVTSRDGLISKYYDYQAELPGGVMKGGSVEEGIQAMQEVHDMVMEEFKAKSNTNCF
jgi:hypothetical protein